MLPWIPNCESHGDFPIEAFRTLLGKVCGSIECQSIVAGLKPEIQREKFFGSSIGIGCPFTDQLPATGRFKFNSDGHAARRPAA